MTLTEIFIANVLFIWGLNFAAYHLFSPITSKYALFLSRYSGKWDWTMRPLFDCKPCMSSIWGIGFWITSFDWYYYPIWVTCLAGASFVLSKMQ